MWEIKTVISKKILLACQNIMGQHWMYSKCSYGAKKMLSKWRGEKLVGQLN